MQLAQNVHPIHTQLPGETVEAAIRANAKMFRLLSDKLYSDKIGAILRELGANAVDSHKSAGKPNAPFKVVLPTALDPVLRIRDYGTGMSWDFLKSTYFTYGDTDKDHDNVAIGGLGLGGKSPLAYADSYHITSWHAGEKKTYVVFINNNGKPSLSGALSTEPCGDETGVEILIPVAQTDYQKFRETATRIFRWFEPLPICNTPIAPVSWILKNDVFGIRQTNSYRDPMHVIMGPIAYPVDREQIRQHLYDLPQRKRDLIVGLFDTNGMCLFLPIGSVDITPNREALSYDGTSLNRLIEALNTAAESILTEIDKTLDAEECYTDAVIKHARLLQESRIDSDLLKHASWRGHKIQRGIRIPRQLKFDVIFQSDFRFKNRMKIVWRHFDYNFTEWSESNYKPPKVYYSTNPKTRISQTLKFNQPKLITEVPFILLQTPTQAQINELRIAFDDQLELHKLEDLPQRPKSVRARVAAPSTTSSTSRTRRAPRTAQLPYINSENSNPTKLMTVPLKELLDKVCYLVAKPKNCWLVGGRNATGSTLDTISTHPALLPDWTILLVPEHHKKTLAELQCPTLESLLEARYNELPGTQWDDGYLEDWNEKKLHDEYQFLWELTGSATDQLSETLPRSPITHAFVKVHEVTNYVARLRELRHIRMMHTKAPPSPRIHWVAGLNQNLNTILKRYPLLYSAYTAEYRDSRWAHNDQGTQLVQIAGFADYIRHYDNLEND